MIYEIRTTLKDGTVYLVQENGLTVNDPTDLYALANQISAYAYGVEEQLRHGETSSTQGQQPQPDQKEA
jgi:hypothetical protein